MCGIAGIINLTIPARIDPEMIRRMANTLVHRGPDDDGYVLRPGVALACRRLSIVGLAQGRQPMHNEDRSISVVFNGELFDHSQIRSELIAKGHVLRTRCDTEVIPHLWEDHGERMLERLRGQFAIAVWDERRGELVLARDRFGICPLFWTRQRTPQGELLLFASEIKALLASRLVPARPDPRGIDDVFTFFASPGPATCFAGISSLLPGRYLKILPGSAETRLGGDAGRIEERAYWQIDFPDRGEEEHGLPRGDSRANARLVDECEQVMKKAVERRLRADVPVVSYLSGGVDSSLVAALACAQRHDEGDGPIPTYTVAIEEPGLNETAEAARVAQLLGSRHTVVSCGRQEVIEAYPQLIRAAEAPVIDTSCAALLLLARRVHEDGHKVAVTGEGADEWLAGYPWFKAHRLLGCLDIVPGVKLSGYARRLFLRTTGAPRFSWDRAREVEAIVGGPNAWLNIYGLFGAMKLRFFSTGMWEQLAGRIPYADLQLDVERSRKWHPFNRSVYLGARVMLPGLLLAAKGDRVAMNSSVETRYPYLDEDVFAFLARLHPAWKMSGLRDKLILRRVAERWLPATTAWRRKAMFRAPFDAFHGHSAPPFVGQLLSREALHKTGYFDVPAVTHWHNAARAMRAGSIQRTMTEMALTGVVATQLWHHLYIDGTVADLALEGLST